MGRSPSQLNGLGVVLSDVRPRDYQLCKQMGTTVVVPLMNPRPIDIRFTPHSLTDRHSTLSTWCQKVRCTKKAGLVLFRSPVHLFLIVVELQYSPPDENGELYN